MIVATWVISRYKVAVEP